MKISEERKENLYSAIYDQIMSLRIDHSAGRIKDFDDALFHLESRIWREVKKALKLEDGE